MEHKIYINEKRKCIHDDTGIEQVKFLHGTICAMIIKKYLPECRISSLRVLNENGAGLIEKLQPAMEWCLQNKNYIVNLSLGSTYFKDKNTIRTLINHYANKGLLMIASTANNGYVTYPASFANTIGVAIDSSEYHSFVDNEHLGIDVLVPVEHELIVGNEKITAQKSNSYAAPYVTSLIGKMYLEMNLQSMKEMKQALHCISDKSIHPLGGCFEPDWISTAVLRIDQSKSSAAYYFSTVDGTTREALKQADTIITDDLGRAEESILNDKHIVYLGHGEINRQNTGRFFWSPDIRLKQVLGSTNGEKLDIPVVLCEIENGIDEMLLLTELKKNFLEDGYNMYTASFMEESVLYDLEYLPEETLEKENRVHFNSFIYWQTYYKQSDGIVFGIHEKYIQKTKQLQTEADLRIKFEVCTKGYHVTILCENLNKWKKMFNIINVGSLKAIYHNIKKLLVRNENEQ